VFCMDFLSVSPVMADACVGHVHVDVEHEYRLGGGYTETWWR
jgi:hypothetical protein